jgi:hypothetical protein
MFWHGGREHLRPPSVIDRPVVFLFLRERFGVPESSFLPRPNDPQRKTDQEGE